MAASFYAANLPPGGLETEMNDTQLTELLRALPRTNASPQFSSDVMRAVRNAAPEPRPAFTWRVAAAFAMALCLVLVIQAGLVQHAKDKQARLEAMRAEQHRIESELAAVKQQTYEPVVVLEHTDGTRVVVDQTPKDPAIVPASYSYD